MCLDDRIYQAIDPDAGLCADANTIIGIGPQRVHHLLGDFVGTRVLEINLVDDRDDVQFVFHRRVSIGDCLSFNALERIDQQQSSLAAGQRTRDFVMKVDVAGRVDQVELILVLTAFELHHDRAGFDRDAAFAFQFQVVEQLFLHLARADGAGFFQQPIRQCAFAVVDMGDDAKVANVFCHVDVVVRCRA